MVVNWEQQPVGEIRHTDHGNDGWVEHHDVCMVDEFPPCHEAALMPSVMMTIGLRAYRARKLPSDCQ